MPQHRDEPPKSRTLHHSLGYDAPTFAEMALAEIDRLSDRTKSIAHSTKRETLSELAIEPHVLPTDKEKSTGDKSKYYEIHLPQRLIDKVNEKGFLEVEDIITCAFGNDMDYGTAFKSLKRMYEDQHGKGKEGSDLKYNATKVHYSVDKIEREA